MRILAATVAIATTLLCLDPIAQAQTYTFTKTAETSDPNQYFAAVSFLSDTGSVAYTLYNYSPNPYGLTPLIQPGAYVNENGTVRRLGDPSLSTIAVDINNSGSVLFLQSENDSRTHLYVDTGGSLTEISSSDTSGFAGYSVADGGASINDNADVVFGATKDSGVFGIYVSSADGSLTTVAETGSAYPWFSGSSGGIKINNNRNVTFTIGYDVYFGAAGGQLTNVSLISPYLTASPTSLSNPFLNNNDAVVFSIYGYQATAPAGAILQSTAGGPAQPVVNGTGPTVAQVYSPAINDAGTIAYFSSSLSPFGYYLNLLPNGGAPVIVIGTGSVLFGNTVSALGNQIKFIANRYLNNSGQLAFSYTLTNGARGIAVATPHPLRSPLSGPRAVSDDLASASCRSKAPSEPRP